MTERQAIETTYADLRPDDLVVDKSGKAWPIAELRGNDNENIQFWLLDPASKARQHFMQKSATDTVTVSRVPSHTDEAAKLEAEFPQPSDAELLDAIAKSTNFVTMDEALANLEPIAEPEPLVEYTAKESKAAEAATDDSPVRLPSFDSMTPLEQRSHLFLLHGVLAYDLKSRDELAQMHYDAHRQHAEGKLQSKHVPHVHEASA